MHGLIEKLQWFVLSSLSSLQLAAVSPAGLPGWWTPQPEPCTGWGRVRLGKSQILLETCITPLHSPSAQCFKGQAALLAGYTGLHRAPRACHTDCNPTVSSNPAKPPLPRAHACLRYSSTLLVSAWNTSSMVGCMHTDVAHQAWQLVGKASAKPDI